MKAAPTIHIDEFNEYTSNNTGNGFTVLERNHPDFGYWFERNFDLGHIRIYEHKADLSRKVNVQYNDASLDKFVHHCMSVEGELSANFHEPGLEAYLSNHSYHNLYLKSKAYHLTLDGKFHNAHIEIELEHYLELINDCGTWSETLRKSVDENRVHYPGEMRMSQQMLQTIYSIFNSPLEGSLKKLLIEGRVQELIALQLHGYLASTAEEKPKKDRDLFQHLREFLDQNFLLDHSLKGLAREFAINEFRLKKGFKENFNTTIFEYLLARRMEWSLHLLKNSSQTITQIAGIVGYRYPHHFSTAFKRHFGYSPAKWRKSESSLVALI